MTPNNNLSALPFYESEGEQLSKRELFYGEQFALLSPFGRILPFQIQRSHSSNTDLTVKLVKVSDNSETDITANLALLGLSIIPFESYRYDIIKFYSPFALSVPLSEGFYFLKVSDYSQTWYSEIFSFVQNLQAKTLKLSFWDVSDLVFNSGRVVYDNYKNIFYLPTEMGMPDYEFEEVVENRDGYQFIEKQISEKTYKFKFVASESQLDVLRLARLSDKKVIECNGKTYNIEQLLFTSKWLEGGFLASVEAEFQCDTVIKKTGNSSPQMSGDFNNDFNNDFLIS